MRNLFGVLVSINLVFQPLQVFPTPNYYTGTATNLWSNGGNGHFVKNQGVPVSAPSIFLVKTASYIDDTAGVCKEANGQFADPKYCDKYYDCWEGRPVSKRCYNGLMFNENISSCDYPSNVNCDGKDVNHPIEKDKGCEQAYGKFADSRDCRKYTVCHTGKATYFICEEGLAYDKDNGHCAAPSNPICLQGPPNDIPEGQDFPEIPLDPDTIKPVPPSGPSGGGSDTVFPITPDWPQGTKCPTSSSGFFPVAKDCKSVIVCIRGSGYLLTCPFGTYYHAAIASCRPGKSDSCEQMRFTMVNTKSSGTDEKFAYMKQGYPLLPLYTW